jgi:hypothetical protein
MRECSGRTFGASLYQFVSPIEIAQPFICRWRIRLQAVFEEAFPGLQGPEHYTRLLSRQYLLL